MEDDVYLMFLITYSIVCDKSIMGNKRILEYDSEVGFINYLCFSVLFQCL